MLWVHFISPLVGARIAFGNPFESFIWSHIIWPLLGTVVIFVLVVTKSLLREQYVKQFRPAFASELAPPSSYVVAMNQTAKQLGFKHSGFFLQTPHRLLSRICLTVWLSADRLTLVLVQGGKWFGCLPYRITSLTSQLEDCRFVVTLDKFCPEDLSGLSISEVLMKASLNELYGRHQLRLQAAPSKPKPFAATHVMEQYEVLERHKAERLVSLRLARFVNPQRTIYRFTMKGALRSYASSRGQIRKAEKQAKERSHVKRPRNN